MVDLLHLATVETLTWKPPTPPAPPPPLPAIRICAVDMVLQWAGLPAKPEPTHQSADYLVAMHELVRRIAQLRTQAPTAEQTKMACLLPQLKTEVEAVIQAQTAWRAGSPSPASANPAAATLSAISGNSPAQPELHLHQEWQVCVAQWLWWIAQSSHEALRLLEGCPVQVMTAAGEQSGLLRLVVGLTLQPISSQPTFDQAALAQPVLGQPAPPAPASTPVAHSAPRIPAAREQTFDLVTGEAMPPLLSAAQRIQVANSLIAQPVTAGGLLQRFTEQILEAAPTLRCCFEGLPARWLIPLQPWQTGTLRLSLGLTFGTIEPGSDSPVLVQTPNPQTSGQPVGPRLDPRAEQGAEAVETGLPQISFSQPDWLEQHVSIAVAQQLTQMFLQQPPVRNGAEAVLTHCCGLIDQLQDSLTLASRIFAQQSLALNELAFRLQWGINRTAYEVMQLGSGLAVRLLQPQQPWQTGRLRLAIWLTVRTPEQRWQFDVAERSVYPNLDGPNPEVSTHPEPNPNSATSGSTAPITGAALEQTVAQTAEHDWCLRPVPLAQLEAAFWQQIEQAAPEIALLRSDTEVMVSTTRSQGELGVLRLETAFEFWPDGVSSKPPGW